METQVMETVFTETSMWITENISSTPSGDSIPFSTYALAVFVASMMILITVAPNIMMIVLVIVDRKLRKLSNYYIISLAVADCIVGAVVMPCMASYSILGFWALGGVVCDVWITFDFMCCTASMLSLCMISLDRYWAITRPLKHMGRRSRKRALFYVAGIWVASAVCWVPAIVAFRLVYGSFGKYDCIYLTDPIYVLISAILVYYMPMAAMIYLYVKVYISVKSQFKSLESFENSPIDKPKTSQSTKVDGVLNNSGTSATTILSTTLSEIATNDVSAAYMNRGYMGSTQSLNEVQVESALSNERPSPNDVIKTSGIAVGITGPDMNTSDMLENSTLCLTPTDDITLRSVSATVAGNQGTIVSAAEMRKVRLRKVQLKHAAINRRTARALGIIVVLFLICWLPFVVLFPINAFCNCVPVKLYDASYWLAYLNSTLNPFLYGFSLDFRRAFMRYFCKRCVPVTLQDVSNTEDSKGNLNQSQHH
ncbi:probable G-protein coupled receptor No18 [Patiria miniata]|uniref:G-protein coupled receptors family 1 profile domain-containing protein n=1 Tax=Patiria miniata TaxID=46514 RepID=A0A914ACU7_PATMI|nr:probable G-protein coupled receptor No18 [Patiria miniata]